MSKVLYLLVVTVATVDAQSLSYEFFRDRVQPIFLAKRPGHARCIECHENRNPFLQELAPGATTWTEEQSRKNFEAGRRVVTPEHPMASRMPMHPLAPGATAWTPEQTRANFAVVSKLIAPGEPDKSPLLLHPLAAEAGGDPTHTGGKFWTSKESPEWQMLAGWAKTGSAAGARTAAVTLDYAFFRDRVQPIFVAKRPGHARCVECHDNRTPRLQELAPGASTWN